MVVMILRKKLDGRKDLKEKTGWPVKTEWPFLIVDETPGQHRFLFLQSQNSFAFALFCSLYMIEIIST